MHHKLARRCVSLERNAVDLQIVRDSGGQSNRRRVKELFESKHKHVDHLFISVSCPSYKIL